MTPHEFGPGEYRMRGGGEAVVYERIDGSIFGRMRDAGEDRWCAVSWYDDGTWMFGRTEPRDLLPPEPPIVVSDEAVDAYWSGTRDARGLSEHLGTTAAETRAGLAAAFAVMLRERQP